jgi:hypothetical protein
MWHVGRHEDEVVGTMDQTVIAGYRLSHELTLGPSSSTRRKKNLLPKVLPVRHLRGSSS